MTKLLALTKNTFRETIRDRILLVIIFFAVLFLLSSKLMAEISMGQNDKINLDFGLAMISIFGVLITIFVGTNLVYKEIDRKTIFTLLSKPIPRSTFIFSKFFGLGAVLFVITIFMGIIFAFVVPMSLKLILAISMMFLSFLLLLAVVIFFSSFMRPLLAAFSSIIVFLIGHLTDDLRIFADYNEISVAFKKFAYGIYYAWPNFEILNLKNVVAYDDFVFTKYDALYTTSMTVIFVMILLYAGALIFKRREF